MNMRMMVMIMAVLHHTASNFPEIPVTAVSDEEMAQQQPQVL